jgi:hypothetical protein
MDEHLIFFIDFVGFAETVRTLDKEKMATLIALLRNLATLRSEFDFSEKQLVEGGIQRQFKAAITTFSDHIVISYPIEHLLKSGGNSLGLETGLLLVQRIIGALAAAAVSLGLLIRGGATVGPLYHKDGVVFGEAMNEAYYLESRVSIYPRITVSRKIYSEIKTNPRSLVLLEDRDGIIHFNYFMMMIMTGGGAGQPGVNFKEQIKIWLTETRQTIALNIEQFEKAERWNELAKWVWFSNTFEQARANINPMIFE